MLYPPTVTKQLADKLDASDHDAIIKLFIELSIPAPDEKEVMSETQYRTFTSNVLTPQLEAIRQYLTTIGGIVRSEEIGGVLHADVPAGAVPRLAEQPGIKRVARRHDASAAEQLHDCNNAPQLHQIRRLMG